MHPLFQGGDDSLAGGGQRIFLLLQALPDFTCIAALRLDLTPTPLSDPINIASECARSAIQRRPTSVTYLVLMGQHAHCNAPLAGSDLTAKIIEVGGTGFFDRHDRLDHTIPERGLSLIVGPPARAGLLAAFAGVSRFAILPILYLLAC